MAILATGNTFADGDQVTSTKLNNIADAATFAADAVDDSTTALSGGKVIVKDAGITPAKLSTNHPNWDSTGLGVGTSSPSSKLDVETSSSSADGVDINNTSTGDPVIEFQLSGTSKFTMGVDNSDSDKFKIGTTAVETATCLTIDSTGPKITIGNGAAADTAIIFDGNAQDFYIGLDDSADDLLIGLGSTIGTTPAITIDENLKSTFGGDVVIGGTTPTLTIGDAGAEDTAIVFDGNAQDFYIGLDDSADDLIIGVGSTVGTTPAISITDGRAVTLNTSLTLATGSTVTAVLDQDNMSSDSATSLATQQSIKAYVDAQVDTADTLAEILAIGNTSGGTDIELSTTDKTQFRDSAIYINSSTDGQLDIVADTEIQIAATTIDINGAVALNGAITGATNITLSGELDAATLDISGVADIAGTTNLDVVDIDGAVDMASTLTVAGVLTGASLDISGDVDVDGTLETDAFSINGTTVSSTAAELNLLDGSSANTVVNSKAVIYGSSGEVAGTLSTAAQTSVTSLGTLTALTVDDVAINGKVITMTGSTSDTAVLTVGTNGTLSIITTDAAAAAANIQITADGTVDIDSAGVLTLDSGADINIEPASGSVILLDGTISVDAGVVTGATSITSTAFVGTLSTAAQANITSLGTLTTIDVNGTSNLDAVDIDGAVDMATTLTVAGNVGFGTTSPSKSLVVNEDDSECVILVTSSDSGTAGIYFGDQSDAIVGGVVFDNSADTLQLRSSNNHTAVTIDSSENVGIGDTTPTYKLDVNGTGRFVGNVQMDGTLTVGVNDTGKDVKFFGAAAGAYLLWDESTDDLILGGAAQLGIGTTSPSKKLHIASNANGQTTADIPGIRIENTDVTTVTTDVVGEIDFFSNDASESDKITGFIKSVAEDAGTQYALTFGSKASGSHATERMRIDDSGNVGIGTASPEAELHVQGPAGSAAEIYLTDGDATGAANSLLLQQTSGTSYIRNRKSDGPLYLGAGDSNHLSILSGGNVGINDTTPSYKLDVNGTGRFTGAVQLDDDLTVDGTILTNTNLKVNSSGALRVVHSTDPNNGYSEWYNSGNVKKIRLWASSGVETDNLAISVKDSIGGTILSQMDTTGGGTFTGNLAVTGSVSKGSGGFKIHHPLESKKDTHHLVHSFIEGPQADLIYRGKVDLVDGSATVNVDTSSGMTDGTFVVLCRDIQSFTTNESGWTAVRSSVSGNILTIEAQDATCTDSISWMVVGERQDDHMLDTGWTDETGKVIVEPLIPEPEPEEEPVMEEPVIEEEEVEPVIEEPLIPEEEEEVLIREEPEEEEEVFIPEEPEEEEEEEDE